ncbi:CaiB/BaiF CoA-transferase family protein [Mycobacterium sp. CVI_P3]|uniref:CaiB/BaiF CoA-transferase family protein n=1 Tax=Mycobacterium pinniadriaticum TaxID=2994102 RepID=A0ABT3SMF5_9MYCO|nr:CaiB/BaiF CoA-transferase family protein [Mycobacterium pinniadriaticum]MCX2934256.1 CaiB/BaiF CoA-transferase family protein [Mycobacterium pinniadriaticum]MCX2940706.1 CaiB/BaiF CoA-transferase family protein [Mycobacterium pinniadriaticum]
MVDRGPLAGLQVVELAGIGPGPYAAMLMADMGADVISIERPVSSQTAKAATDDLLRRSRRSVIVDLQQQRGATTVLSLVSKADVLIEGFRPGVAERLGLGPEDCWEANPRLVYGRMTGWGQSGPLAPSAGHDISYIAVTGALGSIGQAGQPPVPPVNLVGDFGGGSLFLVMGVLAALWEVQRSGLGQVVDAAIVDGTSSLLTLLHGLRASGSWSDDRGTNLIDTGVPWYDTYQTADGEWMAVGALEQRFYSDFIRLLGLPDDMLRGRHDPSNWARMRLAISERFATRSRAEWTAIFEGTDACVAPVMSLSEAPLHPHLASRETFIDVGGVTQPAPAPRFSRTPCATPEPPRRRGADTIEVLRGSGIGHIDRLLSEGTVQGVSGSP